jgi:DNA-binding MarR family transcriptional regulator
LSSERAEIKIVSDSEKITEIILAIFRLNGRIIEWGDDLSSEFGLTSARWQVLGAITLADAPQTVPEIADRMGVSRQATQKQVNLLEAEALVSKRPNPRHRRSPHYRLTEAGERVYSQVWEKYQAWTLEASRDVPAAVLDGALTGLRFLDASLPKVKGE